MSQATFSQGFKYFPTPTRTYPIDTGLFLFFDKHPEIRKLEIRPLPFGLTTSQRRQLGTLVATLLNTALQKNVKTFIKNNKVTWLCRPVGQNLQFSLWPIEVEDSSLSEIQSVAEKIFTFYSLDVEKIWIASTLE
jgi:hypothetical protein